MGQSDLNYITEFKKGYVPLHAKAAVLDPEL